MSKRRHPPGFTRQGILDLNMPGWKDRVRVKPKPVTDPVWWSTRDIADLLYTGSQETTNAVAAEIVKAFPEGKTIVAWDDIHEYRLKVQIPGITRMEWYQWLIQQGLLSLSLWFQMDARIHFKEMVRLFEQAKGSIPATAA